MNSNFLKSACFAAWVALCSVALAKIPAPVLSDEAKAKAEEAKAKTAHTDKVGNYKLCMAQDRAASKYYADMQRSSKATKPATAVAPCADPGAFVYVPVVAGAAVAAAPAAATAAKPGAAAVTPPAAASSAPKKS
jgi:hypothetical protein